MPDGARYAVWGMLDSLNDIGISAENDHYRGAFAHFAFFAIIWRGEERKMPMFSILSNWQSPRFHPTDAACEVRICIEFQWVAAR
jgi:hypothetical protein